MTAWCIPWDPPAVLVRTGECLVPSDLSRRRADVLVQLGFADLTSIGWLGVLTLTDAGRAALGVAA